MYAQSLQIIVQSLQQKGEFVRLDRQVSEEMT
jgi:hypothetical protein